MKFLPVVADEILL